MEPFALKTNRRPQLHWWAMAGVAAAFFVWSFDLIPRVRSAATGTVATPRDESGENDPEYAIHDELKDDWSTEIHESIQHSDDESTHRSPFEADDPLAHALAQTTDAGLSGLEEPATGDDDSAVSAERRIRRDPHVVGAGHVAADSKATARAVASQSPSHPQILPADVAAQIKQVDEWFAQDQVLDAHAELSRLYWKHRDLRELIQERIEHTAALIFTSPDRQFGPPHFVEYGQTLDQIAREYEVPWEYLAMLNRVTPEKLKAGQELKVVRGPFGAVVDLEEFTLTVHAHGWYIKKYRIGIGRDEKTPLGEFTVKDKLENPTWYNPDGGIVEPDDPENPLGEYWLGLGNHIGIHGTNDPASIGQAASRGCIHLGDDDIAEVFGLLSPGSKVLIRK